MLVISRGDGELLKIDGRNGWHFPRTVEGAYGGGPPADSAVAITHLNALRARGAGFLVIPATELWWLDYYQRFGEHLERDHRRIWNDGRCMIYQLSGQRYGSEPPTGADSSAAAGSEMQADCPPAGEVNFGDLRRTTPIHPDFGWQRGLPIDRYYIETFLERHAAHIRGRVLEIADNFYTTRFGGARVTRSDVLHPSEGNPRATIVADLVDAPQIPADSFDCLIVTQTLQFIYDVGSAVRTMYRVLKPGGVLLATMPGISQISRDVWGEEWCWNFTRKSARRLFGEAFPDVEVASHGNVLTAIAFLHGLAADELTPQEFEQSDSAYELLIAIRAVKPA
ncbi:MAG: class I SAM-dependent methyltransferase [Gemmatimonadota bacterium]